MARVVNEAELEALGERTLRERLAAATGEEADLLAGEMERRGLGDWPDAA